MTNDTTTTTHYHAGYNMPGYVPEMDASYPFASFGEAKASMIDDLDRHGDHEFDSDTPEGKDLADELSATMEDLNLDNGPEWGTIVGNTSYWIVACSDESCSDVES